MAMTNESLIHQAVLQFLDKHVAIRSVVGATCLLSMLGSVLIVLSYCCFKQLRSQARQILVNLSIMDFGVGLANFIGIVVYFDGYYFDKSTNRTVHPSFYNAGYIDELCKAQAFAASFTTLASILWTITLAIYMYLLVFRYEPKMIRFYLLAYPLNYILSVAVGVWLLLTRRLGHAPYNSSGWCSIILVRGDHSIDLIATTIGYDLWVYLAIFICTTVYVAIVLFLKTEYVGAKRVVGTRKVWLSALGMMDFRLVFIPAAFILLRMWTCIVNIVLSYARVSPGDLSKASRDLTFVLIMLSGIGDSGQGAANGLLFVIFAGSVRRKLFPLQYCCKTQETAGNGQRTLDSQGGLATDSTNETEKIITPQASLT